MIKRNKLLLKTKLPVILASKSKIRKKILNEAGLEFTQKDSKLDEAGLKNKYFSKNISDIAKKLADAKASKVSNIYKEAYVIGSDQICAVGNKILSKPENKLKAIQQLKFLSGKTHKQISAISICYKGKVIWSYFEIATLKMRKLPIKLITKYVDIDNPIYSCGSYKFESQGKYLFSKIDGNISTILGLPLFPLLNILFKKKVIVYG